MQIYIKTDKIMVMLILLKEKATREQIKEASKDLENYVKFVVDIEREIMTIGGTRHYLGEEILLNDGSKQSNLWGGGYDPITDTIDHESFINIRSEDNNPNKLVLSETIREKMSKIFNKLYDRSITK
jgi:hypothetical protein